jgi:hypothetical protein
MATCALLQFRWHSCRGLCHRLQFGETLSCSGLSNLGNLADKRNCYRHAALTLTAIDFTNCNSARWKMPRQNGVQKAARSVRLGAVSG